MYINTCGVKELGKKLASDVGMELVTFYRLVGRSTSEPWQASSLNFCWVITLGVYHAVT